jgi:hypothetical protein
MEIEQYAGTDLVTSAAQLHRYVQDRNSIAWEELYVSQTQYIEIIALRHIHMLLENYFN